MPLQFVSHTEIAFRQLLGMLRTPPFAMLNYYTNLFISAKFVLNDQPEKVRKLEKEIRRVECMVGVHRTANSKKILDRLKKLERFQQILEDDQRRITSMFDNADEELKKELIKTYEELGKRLEKIDNHQHYLLFKLKPLMSLKKIETFMDNNINLKSYFKENGKKITQLDLMSELDDIKNWIYEEAVELMPYVRFTKLE